MPDRLIRYWLWDYASNTGAHTFDLLPKQIVELLVLGDPFKPAQFIVESRWGRSLQAAVCRLRLSWHRSR